MDDVGRISSNHSNSFLRHGPKRTSVDYTIFETLISELYIYIYISIFILYYKNNSVFLRTALLLLNLSGDCPDLLCTHPTYKGEYLPQAPSRALGGTPQSSSIHRRVTSCVSTQIVFFPPSETSDRCHGTTHSEQLNRHNGLYVTNR